MLARGERPREADFEDRWKKFRSRFSAAQHGKCAYCEGRVVSTDVGALEHYRPKAGLQELPADRRRWGHEVVVKEARGEHATGEVRGRSLDPSEGQMWPGYPWLAYAWENYLFSCDRCNTGWKRNLFPVAERPRCIPPRPEVQETPLLLNPYEGPDPAEHLRFTDRGGVIARDDSPHGTATIDTCGLNRPSLLDDRQAYARQVSGILRAIDNEIRDAPLYGFLRDLREMGSPEREYAAMTRSIAEQHLDMIWIDICALIP